MNGLAGSLAKWSVQSETRCFGRFKMECKKSLHYGFEALAGFAGFGAESAGYFAGAVGTAAGVASVLGDSLESGAETAGAGGAGWDAGTAGASAPTIG